MFDAMHSCFKKNLILIEIMKEKATRQLSPFFVALSSDLLLYRRHIEYIYEEINVCLYLRANFHSFFFK